ncbi:MAG: hypothetical protein ACJ8AW_03465 [Rhodopila sp.]
MTDTIIVLAHATDAGAASVAMWLAREHGAEGVRIVLPEELSRAQWSHAIDTHGCASTSLTLPKAGLLTSATVGAVLNRISYLPVPGFRRTSAKDRDYASAELQAVVASWLAAFGDRSVHPVRRHPWLTPALPLQHWASAAAVVGLPVARRTIVASSRAFGPEVLDASRDVADPLTFAIGTVLVAGSEVAGVFADKHGAQCLAAARRLHFPLLEFQFAGRDGDIHLVGVDPLPSLGEPWAVALAARLLVSLARELRP